MEIKLRCIKKFRSAMNTTLFIKGKVYVVDEILGDYYRIKDEKGFGQHFVYKNYGGIGFRLINFFMSLKEERKLKIRKINDKR